MVMAERTARGSGLSIASAVAVAAIVFCLGRGSLLPFVGLQQDDGHYLVAARSIADGWGYRAAQTPGRPWQTKFPPVFPLSLSVGWSLSSDWPAVAHWQALETLTFGAIAAGLLCLVMVRTAGLSNPLAALATVAGSTAAALLAITAQDMSEPLFMLWIAVAIWSLNVPDDSRFAKTRGVWLALMVLTRSAGLLMCVGAIVWLWRRRALTWTVVVPVGLAVVGWFGWVQFASIGARAPVYEVSYLQWLATVGLTAWPRIVADNLLAVPVHGGSLVVQAPMMMLPTALRPACGFFAGLAVVAAVVWAARSSAGAWPWLLAVYVAGIVLWPWPPSRFLVAVLPLAFCSVLAATRPGSGARRAVAIVLMVLGLSNTVAAVERTFDPRWTRGYALVGAAIAPWSEYTALLNAIRRTTPPDAVIASVVDSMVFLYTDRHGVFPYLQDTIRLNYSPIPSVGGWRELDERLTTTGAAFLARLPAPTWAHTGALDETIAALRAARPGRLRSIYRGADDRFELLEIVRDEAGR